MSPKETWIYVLGTALFSILVVLTLLLPYAVAAVAFSHMVGQHIRQLEEQERRQQEEYNRRRNLLLSDVAHDLKTPMTTVAGYAKALLEEEGAPRREYLEAIYGKSMQMGGLLNLLFEYVKLDSEGYQLDKTEEDLWELLRECIAALYLDFEEKECDQINFDNLCENLSHQLSFYNATYLAMPYLLLFLEKKRKEVFFFPFLLQKQQ